MEAVVSFRASVFISTFPDGGLWGDATPAPPARQLKWLVWICGRRNSRLSGQPGSGKSQLVLDLLAQFSNHGVRSVFFDLKGKLEDDPNNAQLRKNRTRFLEQAGLLSSLARQGRSWGFPVWLASQDADKFLTSGTNETNFAELAECGVHFSPQTLSPADQKLILAAVIHQKFKKAEAALRLGGRLQTGMARQFWKEGGK